jgi:hypothetical protein
MNETNQKINEALRASRGPALTANASDRHKAFNAAIRANIGVTVGGEKRQETPGSDQGQGDDTKHLDHQKSAQEAPRAPQGNAGNGATQVTQAPPDMNSVIRGAWLGKQRNIVNRYTQTGAEVK